jgi:hypothetical protein
MREAQLALQVSNLRILVIYEDISMHGMTQPRRTETNSTLDALRG